MTVARGSCLCGKVTYEVELPFDRFYYCHCSRCRKATGTAHAANGFVKRDKFRWLTGEELVRRYDMPEAKRFAIQNCSHCGARVPHHTRDGSMMVIPVGTLDDDPAQKPQAIVFWGSRAPWYVDCVEVKKHEEMPG
jgi:hypothetical protein